MMRSHLSRSMTIMGVSIMMFGMVNWGAQHTLGDKPTGGARTLIQFRMNVNYFADEAEARGNCRMLRRHLELFKQAGVKASYWFTGLAAEQVQRLDPVFLQRLNDAGMPVAHHGANRPPNPQPIHRVKGQDWEQDVRAILDYESHALDPRTGELDRTKAGGLKAMQQMFDNRIRATGRFFQASILNATKQFGCRAMVGLKDNTGAESNAAWFLGVMGMPDARSIGPEMLRAASRGELDLFRRLENAAAAPPSADVRSVAVLVHDTDFVRGPPRGRERLWEFYEKLVRWAAKHPRLQVVTHEEILDRIADDRAKTVSRAALLRATEVVATSPNAPPDYIDLGGDYLSLADTFQAFAQALREFGDNGTLPESVKTADLLGPTEAFQSSLSSEPSAKLLPKATAEELLAAAKQVCAQLTDRIPTRVTVGAQQLNPAEFMFAMAQTLTAIARTGRPAPVSLQAIALLPARVRANRRADPLTRLQFWTCKPERWKAAAPKPQAAVENQKSKIENPTSAPTFLAVHCEAGTAQIHLDPPLKWQKTFYPALVRFVEMADRYDAKLTLMFNPQWAEYILPDKERFELVKAWQKKGHEVALHYHNERHHAWCGYTDRGEHKSKPGYRGTVGEMMRLLGRLASPDKIMTACCGPDKGFPECPKVSENSIPFDEIEFPDEVIYDVDGIHLDDGLAKPEPFTFKNRVRFHLRHSAFGTREQVEGLKANFGRAKPGEVFGVVTHEMDFARGPAPIEDWFKFTQAQGVKIRTVRDIMEKAESEKPNAAHRD